MCGEKLCGLTVYLHLGGITPACAGKRGGNDNRAGDIGDHPRVCGEKLPGAVSRAKTGGSPPRVRGKGDQTREPVGLVGITPACAGKSSAVTSTSARLEDHPRVCGEKPCPSTLPPRPLGSPPRVRGKGDD